MRIRLIVAMLLAAAMWLSSCSSSKNVKLDPLGLQSLQISMAPKANDGQPIPVNIVFADNNETLKDLEGFTASGWFAVKETNLGNWQDKTVIMSLDAQPGKRITLTEFPEGTAEAVGVVIYANYTNKALNRMVFAEVDEIDLVLTPQGPQSENGKYYFLTSPPEPAQQGQQARY